MAIIKVVDETIYSDGSGVCVVYEVYGLLYIGIRNHEATVTVTPLVTRTGFRNARAKAIVRSSCNAVMSYLSAISVPVFAE